MTNRIQEMRRFRGPLAKVIKDENNEAVLVMVEKSHENWSLTPVFQFAFHILKAMIDGEKHPLSHQLKNISVTQINTLLKYKGLVDLLFSLGCGTKSLMLCAYADWLETDLPGNACGNWCHKTLRWMADKLGDFVITITPPFQEIGGKMMKIAECYDGVLTIREQSIYE